MIFIAAFVDEIADARHEYYRTPGALTMMRVGAEWFQIHWPDKAATKQIEPEWAEGLELDRLDAENRMVDYMRQNVAAAFAECDNIVDMIPNICKYVIAKPVNTIAELAKHDIVVAREKKRITMTQCWRGGCVCFHMDCGHADVGDTNFRLKYCYETETLFLDNEAGRVSNTTVHDTIMIQYSLDLPPRFDIFGPDVRLSHEI